MDEPFEVHLRREAGYRFRASFPGTELDDLQVDEPAPLGEGTGPNPSRLLALAVVDCLSASLLFCLSKSRVEVRDLSARVAGRMGRNERGRWRIEGLDVELVLEVAEEDRPRIERCLGLFEDFCVVTASVRQGVPVSVVVRDPGGTVLHEAPAEGG